MTTLTTAEDRFCDLPGDVRLCYRTTGDPKNPAMMLIAGLGSDLTMWPEPMVDALVEHGFFVVRFDNRDVGRSSRMPTPTPSIVRLALGGVERDGYDLAAMATDAVGLLDHLGIERAHIVGMSMGGMIGQTIAARFGDRVTSLCSIFSTTGSRRIGQPAWSTRLRVALPAARTREQAVKRHVMMMRHIAGTTMALDEAQAADYAANAWDRAGAQENSAGVARQINAIYLSGDRTGELCAITAPTLVIHGDTDKMVHPTGGAATAAAIPDAWILTIAGMGHDLAPQTVEPIVSAVVEHALCHDEPPAPTAARSALLPPGPRWPALVEAVALSVWRPRTMAAMARRYGPEFSMRIPLVGPCVVVTDPAMIKEVFQKPTSELAPADPDLSVMLGSGSTFGLRGEAHRQRRKLLAPPFHGKRMRAYEQLVEDETLREISTWPSNVEFEVMPSTMRITLNIILRAVFGADGTELHELRDLLPRWVEFGSKVFVVPFLHRDLGRFSPWGRHLAMRRQFDAIMETLITKALADPGLEDRDDVLSMLLRARYDDGTAMTHSDIGDELVTLLAAGHETTATTLAWTLERLRRHPDVLRQLVKDIDAGESKMLQTTVFETQRVRPVIDGVARRVVADNLSLGRWVLPRDHRVWISATAVHNDPSRYPDPNTFNPDRFLDANPDNFTWVPFGGGTRRCIGAAFANMEMTVVLRTILRHYSLVPTTAPDEKQRFRGVAFAPARGGLIRVQPRPQQPSVNHPRHLADGAPLSQGR